MVKVKNPLLSASASGKFAKNLFFQRKKSCVSVTMSGNRINKKSSLQLANRARYINACNLWRNKRTQSKNEYNQLAQSTKKTGYNLFVQEYFSGSLRSKIGMNFAHDVDYGAEIDESQMLADLDEIKSHGIYNIRVAMPTYSHAGAISKLKQVCLLAKSAGCSVTWGLAVGDIPVSVTTLPDYANAVLSVAEWAEANRIDMYSIGNEMEMGHDETLTDQDIRDFLRSLATSVKAVYFNGPVIYTCVGSLDGHSSAWSAENNLGDIDILGVNCYVYEGTEFNYFWSVLNNVNEVFAGRFCLTEFNLWGGDGWDFFNNLSEDELAKKIYQELEIIDSFPAMPVYFFCWRFPSDYWSTKKADGTLRTWWLSLT